MERVADNPDVRIQMHLAEMKTEMDWCSNHYQCRPVELVDRSGILSPNAIMAHCLEVTPDEISTLAARRVTVAHNARSNAKVGRGIAPVEAMRQSGIDVGLASDGAMSGNTLNIIAQTAPASMFANCLAAADNPCPPVRL